ncbi:MAG: O-antigen ligase family protein [Candidatus Omnitrophica bacterium]|nr:O-antigen ligase family protein [Candidatus Omnitrophota bacterium]
MSQHPEFAKYFTPTFFHRLESNRVFSTFAYPNIYAGFLITILPFLYFIFLDNIDFKNLRLIRFFSLFLIFLCIINLYFTESVGGFFVLLFVFHIIFLNFLFGPKKFKKILPLLIFFEILFFYLGYKFGKLPHIHSFVDRVYYWKATWKMILYKPILGIGAENFQYYFPKYKLPEGLEVKHAHNLFFETAAETGFLGISLLFIFLVMVILKGFKNEKFRNFNFGISYSLISFLLHNFVDFDFSDPSLAIIFFILGAIIYSKEKEIKQRLTKMVLCFIIILNILCFVTLLRYEISEEICRKRYAVKEKSLEAKIYYLNLAESWYNKNFEIYIDRSDVYINIWRVKENTEYLEKGISDLLKAVYLNPYLIKGFKRLASIYENLGNFEKAEKFYLKLIEIYPNKKLYNLEVARFYKKYGKEKEFKYFYEKSKNLKGVNIEEGILIDEIEKWIESQK